MACYYCGGQRGGCVECRKPPEIDLIHRRETHPYELDPPVPAKPQTEAPPSKAAPAGNWWKV